jgi:hypothetical protein
VPHLPRLPQDSQLAPPTRTGVAKNTDPAADERRAAAIDQALTALAAKSSRLSDQQEVLERHRDAILAAIDANVSATKIAALLSAELSKAARRQVVISADSIWRFGVKNGARRKRAPATRQADGPAASRRRLRAVPSAGPGTGVPPTGGQHAGGSESTAGTVQRFSRDVS